MEATERQAVDNAGSDSVNPRLRREKPGLAHAVAPRAIEKDIRNRHQIIEDFQHSGGVRSAQGKLSALACPGVTQQ